MTNRHMQLENTNNINLTSNAFKPGREIDETGGRLEIEQEIKDLAQVRKNPKHANLIPRSNFS
jgi:hypothetical protein